jgi:hypothetical protein
MSGLHAALAQGTIQQVAADLAVVSFFEDERPLRGVAAQADWRLCGTLSRLIQTGRLSGAFGEAALMPASGGLRAAWVLALGLGSREALDDARRSTLTQDCVQRALGLGAAAIALPLPPGGRSDPGPAARLELLLDALARAAPEVRGDLRIRLVVARDEHPKLTELFQRHARGPGRPGLVIDPPASSERPGRRSPAGSAARVGSPQHEAELRVK